MAQDIGLETILYNAFNHYTNNFYTAIPCIVITVYNNGIDQRLDVQPCINRKSIEGDVTEQPPILNVPLMFPSSNTSAFTFPVNKNDTVLCVFSQRTLDLFKGGSGKPSDPNDFRRFDKRDAVAIPGLFPFNKAINNPKKRTNSHSTSDAVIVHNIGKSTEVEIRLKPNGDLIVNSPHKVIVNATNNVEVNTQASAKVVAAVSADVTAPVATLQASTSFTATSPIITFNGTLVVNGNFSVSSTYTSQFNGNLTMTTGTLNVASGNITAGSKSVGQGHTHSGVQTGGGNTGVPN